MGGTPGKIILHRMGYFNDQAGILSRYDREKTGWDNHIRSCKSLILRALSLFEPHNIAVLGSGSLLDLPLGEMASEGRIIKLVDIVPPLPYVREAALFDGVTFIEADVTGGLISQIYRSTPRSFIKKNINIEALLDFEGYKPPEGTDMVISLNIMTQLAALPVDYLRRKTSISANEERHIHRTVQQRHLEMLQKYNSVLITDYIEQEGMSGEEKSPGPLLEIDLPSGVISEKWEWLFDSHKRYNAGKITSFMVAGIVFHR